MKSKIAAGLGVGVIAVVVAVMAVAGFVAQFITDPNSPIQANIVSRQGPQGAFDVEIFACFADGVIPERPIGGSYQVAEGRVDDQPTGWVRESATQPCPDGEVQWVSSSSVNPGLLRDEAATQPLQWSSPVEVGGAGPTGPAGQAGQQGPPGQDGAQGPAGQDGAQGQTGPAGQAGAQGQAGAAGQDGQTGPAGPTGPTGPTGPQGPAGTGGSVPDDVIRKVGRLTETAPVVDGVRAATFLTNVVEPTSVPTSVAPYTYTGPDSSTYVWVAGLSRVAERNGLHLQVRGLDADGDELYMFAVPYLESAPSTYGQSLEALFDRGIRIDDTPVWRFRYVLPTDAAVRPVTLVTIELSMHESGHVGSLRVLDNVVELRHEQDINSLQILETDVVVSVLEPAVNNLEIQAAQDEGRIGDLESRITAEERSETEDINGLDDRLSTEIAHNEESIAALRTQINAQTRVSHFTAFDHTGANQVGSRTITETAEVVRAAVTAVAMPITFPAPANQDNLRNFGWGAGTFRLTTTKNDITRQEDRAVAGTYPLVSPTAPFTDHTLNFALSTTTGARSHRLTWIIETELRLVDPPTINILDDRFTFTVSTNGDGDSSQTHRMRRSNSSSDDVFVNVNVRRNGTQIRIRVTGLQTDAGGDALSEFNQLHITEVTIRQAIYTPVAVVNYDATGSRMVSLPGWQSNDALPIHIDTSPYRYVVNPAVVGSNFDTAVLTAPLLSGQRVDPFALYTLVDSDAAALTVGDVRGQYHGIDTVWKNQQTGQTIQIRVDVSEIFPVGGTDRVTYAAAVTDATVIPAANEYAVAADVTFAFVGVGVGDTATLGLVRIGSSLYDLETVSVYLRPVYLTAAFQPVPIVDPGLAAGNVPPPGARSIHVIVSLANEPELTETMFLFNVLIAALPTGTDAEVIFGTDTHNPASPESWRRIGIQVTTRSNGGYSIGQAPTENDFPTRGDIVTEIIESAWWI